MFTRHLKKFNNTAEMEAAIAAGTLASPYIAFNTERNIMNMTIPADKEPASIDYQQEGDDSSTGEDPTLTFNYTDVTYNTVADFVPAIYGDTSYYDSVAFFIVEQSTIDDMLIEHGGWSHGDALWSLIEGDETTVVTDASAGDTVSLASSLNAYYDSQNVYVFALLEHYENGERDFYQPIPTDDNYAFELVEWAEAEEPTTTYFTMNVNSHAFDPNDSSTYDVNVEFSGYPGDLSWPYVTFGAYKVTEQTPYADVTTMSNVLGQDYDCFPAGGSGTHTIEIAIDLQPGESAYYCVCAAPMNDAPATEMMYVAYQQVLVTVPSEGGDSSTWWEDFNFDDEPADTDMIEHHEQTPGDEEAMSTLYTLPQSELGIINNALGGNRTLETAIIVNPTVTEEEGEFSISGGRAIIGDASGNFIAFEDCSIGFDDDSYLVIKSVKNAPANGILSSPPPYETVENYYSILHFGSQDLALLRIDIDGSNSNWINVNAIRYSSNTPVHDASTAWYQNVNFEVTEPNYNDCVDANMVEEEYRNFADAVSNLSVLNDVFNNPEPGEDWTNNSVVSLVIGGTYSAGYLSGGRQVPGTININTKTITFNNVSFTSDQMIYLVVDFCTTEPCDTPFESHTVIWHTYGITRAVAGQNSGTTCTITATLDEWDSITGFEFDYGTSGEGGDSSTDVSLGYKFAVGQNNTGYFNTGYVPGIDTVVQLRGTIIDDGTVTHGIKTGHGEWQYRIFGYAGAVYYDRVDDDVRLNADEDLTVPHNYEFGNFYIKIDGNTVASDAVDMSNFFTEQQLFVFAGSEQGAMGESIPAAIAAQGTQLEYFKILEPDGNGGLNLEMDLRPALDASGNICLYDQVAGDAIYPEGSSVNIIATAISGDEPGPDSSTSSNDIIAMHGNPGPTPTTVNPFITLVVDASIAALSSWDHMEVGIYSLNHYENNGYSSINDYRQNGFIKTCTIALTDGTAHYNIQTADDLNCTRIPAGDGYTFTGYDDTICVVAWFETGYGAQQVAESNEIFELYEYELPRDL